MNQKVDKIRKYTHSKLIIFIAYKLIRNVIFYLESIEMKFTFTAEIKFKNFMDDDPANILMIILI